MNKLKQLFSWLENALFIQAICTMVSGPILYGWQMPCSKVTVISNIIFTPFMFSFLLVSAIIFIFSLLNLKVEIFGWILEKIFSVWSWFLNFGSSSWLFIPGKVLITVWLVGAVSLFALIIYKKLNLVRRFMIFWLLSFVILSFLPIHEGLYFYGSKDLKKGRCSLTVERDKNNQLTLTDNGFFGRCQSPDNAVIYQLRPFLLTNFGQLKIDKFKLNRLSKRAIFAADTAIKFFDISEFVLPKIKGEYQNDYFLKNIYNRFVSRAIEFGCKIR